jgi:DNA (cytosine-5)-methyltransferase 1
VIDLETFAGPGGWDAGAGALGIRPVGIELDAAACATRRAAGHLTIRADAAAFPLARLAGKVRGHIGSPPCKLYSAAGTGIGRLVLDVLAAAIPQMLAGEDCRGEVRAAICPVALEWRQAENETREPARKWTAGRVEAAARSDAFEASLVLEPARYAAACRPEWIALEQVPAVLPLWQVYAAELRRMGYSAWTGVLNAADYGVPQVRERAFLIASTARRAARPEPTHYDPRKGGQLWGEPWVTMAAALGWGMTGRPYFTLATAGGNRGGADEQVGGSGARRSLYSERDAGRWTVRTSFGQPAAGPKSTGSGSHGTHEMDPFERPAHAVTTKAKDWVAWPAERPATTVLADPRLGRPGHKGRERGGEAHFAKGAVRLTVQEAAILQSFPADYPWQGTKTKAHQQIGNAVPPLLAAHVLSAATGIPLALPRDEEAA